MVQGLLAPQHVPGSQVAPREGGQQQAAAVLNASLSCNSQNLTGSGLPASFLAPRLVFYATLECLLNPDICLTVVQLVAFSECRRLGGGP